MSSNDKYETESGNDKQECEHCSSKITDYIEKECCESYLCSVCNDSCCYQCGRYTCPVCGCEKCGWKWQQRIIFLIWFDKCWLI